MSEIRRPFDGPTPSAIQDFIRATDRYREDDDPTFWTDDRLRDRQNELLRRQLAWIVEGSAFYSSQFAEYDVNIADIQTVDDLRHLPITTKQQLMNNPRSFRLDLPERTVYDTTYSTVYTTGTTLGVPTPYEYTAHDYLGVLEAHVRANKLNYYLPGDLAVVAFPLSPLPHVGAPSWFAMTTAVTGVSFITGLTGTPYSEFSVHRRASELGDIIEARKPQILIGIASFVRRMLADAADEGRHFESLRVILCGGEALTARMRTQMRSNLARLGADRVFITSNYGFTEAAIGSAPCFEGGPMHLSAPDQLYYEILDEQTHERVTDGQVGLLAVTHLNRRGMPLVRYLPGDIAALSRARCPACGRGGQSILMSSGTTYIRRTSDLVKVKGTLVNPHLIHDVVMSTDGVLEYQIVIAKKDETDPLSQDEMRVCVALEAGQSVGDWKGAGARAVALTQAVFNAVELRPTIVVVSDASQIYDPTSEFKARRVRDLRPVGD